MPSTPERPVMLPDRLNGLDAERERRWTTEALELWRANDAGEPTLGADEVFAEARRLVAG